MGYCGYDHHYLLVVANSKRSGNEDTGRIPPNGLRRVGSTGACECDTPHWTRRACDDDCGTTSALD